MADNLSLTTPKVSTILIFNLILKVKCLVIWKSFSMRNNICFIVKEGLAILNLKQKHFFAEVFIKMGRDSLSKIFRDNLDYYKTILEYVKEPDEDKRCDALIAFQRLGYSNFQTKNDVKNLDEILKIYNKYYQKNFFHFSLDSYPTAYIIFAGE